MKQRISYHKIGIIGLGLIGGSIAQKLKQQGYPIFTVKSKSPDIQKAKKIVDRVFPTLDGLLQEIDLLIIATPLSSILQIAKKIKSDHPLLVIDVGSVKGKIVREFQKLSTGWVEFLSTHPMAGTEKKGFEHADPELFQGAPWIIVPHEKNRAKIEPLVRLLGAKPVRMGADEHDRKCALISHLPMLISRTLWDFVQKKDPTSLKIAGPGFRSMTRMAQGNGELAEEIAAFNKKNLKAIWKEWVKFSNSFK